MIETKNLILENSNIKEINNKNIICLSLYECNELIVINCPNLEIIRATNCKKLKFIYTYNLKLIKFINCESLQYLPLSNNDIIYLELINNLLLYKIPKYKLTNYINIKKCPFLQLPSNIDKLNDCNILFNRYVYATIKSKIKNIKRKNIYYILINKNYIHKNLCKLLISYI